MRSSSPPPRLGRRQFGGADGELVGRESLGTCRARRVVEHHPVAVGDGRSDLGRERAVDLGVGGQEDHLVGHVGEEGPDHRESVVAVEPPERGVYDDGHRDLGDLAERPEGRYGEQLLLTGRELGAVEGLAVAVECDGERVGVDINGVEEAGLAGERVEPVEDGVGERPDFPSAEDGGIVGKGVTRADGEPDLLARALARS